MTDNNSAIVATVNPPLTVYRPPMPEPVDPDKWAATHDPTERYVVECLDIGEPPRFLGMSKRRERVCVRSGLFFREYEWQEYDEPQHEYPWYLFEEWRLPDGQLIARKVEVTEQTARMLLDQGVSRGRSASQPNPT